MIFINVQMPTQKISLVSISDIIDSQPIEIDLGEVGKYRVLEIYCGNPECPCESVRLWFMKRGEKTPFFEAYLKVRDFVLDPEFPLSTEAEKHREIIDEFFKNLSEVQKRRIVARYKLAKGIGGGDPTKHVDFSSLELGKCLSYEDIFGREDSDVFEVAHKSKHYFISDQYCFNPLCQCNSAILSVIELDFQKDLLEPIFAINVRFDGRYEIEDIRCPESEVDEFFNDTIKGNKRLFSVLKKRYSMMKDLGRKILRQRWEMKRSRLKVGRNDPCPCGSGKKYKKCCWFKGIDGGK